MKSHNHTVLDSTSLNAYVQSNNGTGLKNPRTNYSSTRGGGNVPSNHNNNNNTMFRGSSSTNRFPKGKSSGSVGNVCASEMSKDQSEEDPELKRQMPLNDPSLKSPLELGRAKNGIYFLCPKCHNCCPSPAEINSSYVKCHLVPSVVNINKDFDPNKCSVHLDTIAQMQK
ncbi:hypothetical protein KY284_032435 [Solanum tuberosum]|nr:hypothetical protein KY284_032435 [Solanum tuberosum]